MTSSSRIASLAVLAFAFMGCGDTRLKVSGSVNLTLMQIGQPDGSTGFTFPADTIVESNPTGFCRISGGRAEVLLERAGGTADGLRSVRVVIPPSSATGSDPATVSFVVGTSTFDGGNTCTRTSAISGSGELRELSVTMECTGLRAQNDARTASASIRLSLSNCTAQ